MTAAPTADGFPAAFAASSLEGILSTVVQLLTYARKHPVVGAAAVVSGLILTPFLVFAAFVVGIGVLCCSPVLLLAGLVYAGRLVLPRLSCWLRAWSSEARLLTMALRRTPTVISLENFVRANPAVLAVVLMSSPALMVLLAFAAVIGSVAVAISIPFLTPGLIYALAHAECRQVATEALLQARGRLAEAYASLTSLDDAATGGEGKLARVVELHGGEHGLSPKADIEPAGPTGAMRSADRWRYLSYAIHDRHANTASTGRGAVALESSEDGSIADSSLESSARDAS